MRARLANAQNDPFSKDSFCKVASRSDVYRKQWKELNLSTQKKDLARLVIDVLLYKKR